MALFTSFSLKTFSLLRNQCFLSMDCLFDSGFQWQTHIKPILNILGIKYASTYPSHILLSISHSRDSSAKKFDNRPLFKLLSTQFGLLPF